MGYTREYLTGPRIEEAPLESASDMAWHRMHYDHSRSNSLVHGSGHIG